MPRSIRSKADALARDAAVRAELLDGLRRTPKTIPARYLYRIRAGEAGTAPEMPAHRSVAEAVTLALHLPAIAARLRPALLVEPGARAGASVRLLLAYPGLVTAYLPLEATLSVSTRAVAELRTAFPGMPILPVCPTLSAAEMHLARTRSRRFACFPGSAICSFPRQEAVGLLREFRDMVGPGGALLVGVDLWKSDAELLAGCRTGDDAMIRFQRGLLERMNADFDTNFRPERFDFQIGCEPLHHRLELMLVSRERQVVRLGPHVVRFARNERLVTERSYQFTSREFSVLARAAGLTVVAAWADPQGVLSLQLCEPANVFDRE